MAATQTMSRRRCEVLVRRWDGVGSGMRRVALNDGRHGASAPGSGASRARVGCRVVPAATTATMPWWPRRRPRRRPCRARRYRSAGTAVVRSDRISSCVLVQQRQVQTDPQGEQRHCGDGEMQYELQRFGANRATSTRPSNRVHRQHDQARRRPARRGRSCGAGASCSPAGRTTARRRSAPRPRPRSEARRRRGCPPRRTVRSSACPWRSCRR